MIFTTNVEVPTIIKSFFIVISIIMFRHFITNIIIKIIKKITEKHKLKYISILIDSIERPLLNFLTYTAIYLALMVLPLQLNIVYLINSTYRAFIIISLTQCLLNIVNAYSVVIANNYLNEETIVKTQISKTMFPILSKLIKVVIIIVAVVAIAVEFNFKQLSSLLAGVGIGGAALALASQDLIKNFFGGFIILTDKSFSVGDWIKVDSFEGTVEELGLRSTKVRTIDKEIVIIPNSRFADREVINFSLRENRRANITLGVTYNTSPEKIKSIINKIENMLESHTMVKENSYLVKFSNFGPSSLDIVVQFLTNTTNYNEFMEIKNDINFKIIDIFKEEEVEFAFPSVSVYMNK